MIKEILPGILAYKDAELYDRLAKSYLDTPNADLVWSKSQQQYLPFNAVEGDRSQFETANVAYGLASDASRKLHTARKLQALYKLAKACVLYINADGSESVRATATKEMHQQIGEMNTKKLLTFIGHADYSNVIWRSRNRYKCLDIAAKEIVEVVHNFLLDIEVEDRDMIAISEGTALNSLVFYKLLNYIHTQDVTGRCAITMFLANTASEGRDTAKQQSDVYERFVYYLEQSHKLVVQAAKQKAQDVS